jgi:hypothetical protein
VFADAEAALSEFFAELMAVYYDIENKNRKLSRREAPDLDVFETKAVSLPLELRDFFCGLGFISEEAAVPRPQSILPTLASILDEYHSRFILIAL